MRSRGSSRAQMALVPCHGAPNTMMFHLPLSTVKTGHSLLFIGDTSVDTV